MRPVPPTTTTEGGPVLEAFVAVPDLLLLISNRIGYCGSDFERRGASRTLLQTPSFGLSNHEWEKHRFAVLETVLHFFNISTGRGSGLLLTEARGPEGIQFSIFLN
jgi:hypothetical protein